MSGSKIALIVLSSVQIIYNICAFIALLCINRRKK